jgi:hypothetical protein
MTFVLILFFGSLVAITFMIGRKLRMIQNGQITVQGSIEEISFKFPAIEEWKQIAAKGIKKYSYSFLVAIIRFYFRSINILKMWYQKIRVRFSRLSKKSTLVPEKKETSKFLKIVSSYKRKIRKIKEKVRKEESL